MKLLSRLTGLLFIASIAFSTNAANVYKWVDEEGVTHYTETAPADREYQKISTSGISSTEAAKARKRLENDRAANEEKKAKKLDYAQQQQMRKEDAQIRKENCDGAKANLKVIQENARVRIKGEDGELRFLTEEEKQLQIDRANEVIKENCEA